ncbi:MAG TPA: 3'-5' exonuclease, partial [Bacteroidota bacterium]|nr:3'-5' exonuclease [Bacteroidota bacterium]
VRVGELLSVLSAATDPSRRAGLMAEISEIMLTAGGGLKKKFAGQALRVMEGTESALILGAFHRDFGGALGAVASESADSSDDGPHARCVSSVLRVFVRAQEGYDRRKEELGMLDFEDLQTRTLELLQQTEILDRIRSEYRFFLVDEFQDTNALQYAIVKSLLGGFDRGNVFIVGDPKQSIYGFRNAEAEVFAEAAGDIASAGRGDSVPRGGNLVLAESFRPLVEIAAFVNHLFSRLMGEGTGPAEVGYEALVVGRDEPGLSGIIELLLAAGADGGAAGTAGEECSMIARRIRALASPAGGGAYAYGDCAVLLRDRRNLPAIERAFEREGVPYTLSGGVGFFQTQEIYDFLNYIGFLLSTEDDPSLAGILRSPFFGISDAELYEVSLRPGSSLWEKFTDAAADPAAGEAFRRAGRALTTHLSLAERIPVPRLLRRIGRDTGWLGTMAGLSHGPQRRENFLKLLELARERDSSGPVSLWDFREFLEHHTVAEGREAQAATTAGTDAVKVMTIHSAKGLEFRAVFIPFLDRKFSHDSEPYIDPVHGVGFSLPDPSGGKPRRGPITPYLSAVSAEKRIAEEKRIFYVACTRAKNVLVLSGRQTAVGSGARAARSPMEWLTGILPGGTPPGASGIVSLGERDIACLSRLEGKIDRVARKVALEIMVRIGEAGFDAIPVGAAGPARRGSPRTIIAPVPDLSGGETYSATQIRTYLECPAKYYLTYVLGVGSGPGRVRPRAGEGHTADRDDERDLAGLEGVLTHQLLSVVDRYPTPSGLAGLLPDLLLCAAAGGAQRGGGLSDRVMANVTAFLDSDAGKRILAGGGPKTEFGIFTRFDDAILTGILDRVYAGEDGRMEFVDYKTDDIPPGEVGPRAEAYSAQMATYALLVGRLYRQAEVTGRLVFIKAGCREVAFEFDPATIDRFSGGIRHVISGIRKRNFSPMPVPCHGCPYREGTRCLVVPGTT